MFETEGAALPTPPRDRAMGWWMIAAAAAVAAIQLLSGAWRLSIAVLPWTILVGGTLIARASVEPLRLIGERFGPDLALAALLAAWLPAAVIWLRRRRYALAVVALLVPLAAAAPHLTPSLYGDEPFHLAVMESLLGDGDLDLYVLSFDEKRSLEDVAATYLGLPGTCERPRLYRNDGKGRFEDVTADAGLALTTFGMGVAVGDFDGGSERVVVALENPTDDELVVQLERAAQDRGPRGAEPVRVERVLRRLDHLRPARARDGSDGMR